MFLKYFKRTLFTRLLITTLLLVLAVFYLYKYNPGFKELFTGETGSIEISISDLGARVYLDNNESGVTDTIDYTMILEDVPVGQHSIIVDSMGKWPWFTSFDLVAGERVVLNSFAVPQISIRSELNKSSRPDYGIIKERLALAKVPAKEAPLLSEDGRVELWADLLGLTVFAKWISSDPLPDRFCTESNCRDTIIIFNSSATLRNVSFLGNRNDVAVIALGDGIYALDITVRKPQNFQPIYDHGRPQFIMRDSMSLYVEESDGKLYEVSY